VREFWIDAQVSLLFKVFQVGGYLTFVIIPTLLTRPKSAGTVFDRTISAKRFNQVFNQSQTLARLNYGDLYKTFSHFLNFYTLTWEQLIQLEEAKNRGISIHNKKLTETIAQIPLFQRDNTFNQRAYTYILRQILETDPPTFEEALRNQLILDELRDSVTAQITVTEESARQAYQQQKSLVRYATLLFSTSAYQDDLTPSEDELNAYFQTNRRHYFTPPAVKVEYIRMDYPKDGGVQKEVETKFKAIAIYNDYIKKPDLVAVAAKQGFTPAITEFFNLKTIPQELGLDIQNLQDIWSMENGRLAQPIEQPEGYRIVKMLTKRPAYYPPLKIMREKVTADWQQEQSQTLAEQAATQSRQVLLEQLAQQPDLVLQDWAQTSNLEFNETALLPIDEIILSFGISPVEAEKLYTLSPETSLSVPVKLSDGYALFTRIEYQPAPLADYDNDKESFRLEYTVRHKADTYAAYLEDLKQQADLRVNPEFTHNPWRE